MFWYTVANTVMCILAIVAVGYCAFRLYAYRQGDEHIVFSTKRRTAFALEDIGFDRVVLYSDIPYENKGKQNGTLMDVYPRHLLPQEQFDNVGIVSRTTSLEKERHDGYWEAVIIPPGKGGHVRLRVEMTAKNGNIRSDLNDFPDMPIDIVYQVVGRSDWYITKARIVLDADEVVQALRR